MKNRSSIITFFLLIILVICFVPNQAEAAFNPKYYQTSKASVPIMREPSLTSAKVDTISSAGYVLYTSSGKATVSGIWYNIGSGKYKGYWVFSGNVAAHTHTCSNTYACKNDCLHTTTHTCKASGCDYSYTSEDEHTFKNGACTKCGAPKPKTSGGTYLALKTVSAYTKASSSSSKAGTIKGKASSPIKVTIKKVSLNSAKNYWGYTSDNSWVYMGNLDYYTPAASVKLSSASVTKYNITGTSFKLTAAIAPEAAYDLIKWSSSNQSVATVAGDGTVTISGGAGSADIIAQSYTDPKISATCKLTVKDCSGYFIGKADEIKTLFIDWSKYNKAELQNGYGYCTKNGKSEANNECDNCKIGSVTSAMKNAGFISFTVTGGYSCNGFARFALRYIYGSDIFTSMVESGTLNTSVNKSNSAVLNFLKNNKAKTGDMLIIKNSKSHYMILLSINEKKNSAKILDGNGDGKCGVRVQDIEFSKLYSRDSLIIKKANDSVYNKLFSK